MRKSILNILFAILTLHAVAQTAQEKIYVSTDKSFYVTGEVMWFRLFVVDAVYNKPIDISKVAYVELLTPDMKHVAQGKIELNAGAGNGSFFMSSSFNSGTYILRCYTNWMKNFSADNFFHKEISIINPLKDNSSFKISPQSSSKESSGTLLFDLQAPTQAKSRQKIDLEITSRNVSGNSVAADFSISVYLVDSLQRPGDQDMFTSQFTPSVAEGRLDLKSNTLQYLPEFEGHFITAKVIDKRTNAPASGITTYLSMPGDRFQFSMNKSDKNGIVRFDAKHFYGAGEIILQTNPETDSVYRIEVQNPFSEKFSNVQLSSVNLDPSMNAQLVNHVKGTQVQQAFHTDKRQQFFSPDLPDTTGFYGNGTTTYMLDDYTRFKTMEEVMREYVAEVQVRKTRGSFHFNVMNVPYKLYFENNPLVLIDGVPVFDMNKFIALDPLRIKRLDVVSRKYHFGSFGFDGIISARSYLGDMAGYPLDPNALVLSYEGLQLEREFYSPVYETRDQVESRMPDFRNVLNWEPSVPTDSTGKAHLSFYTSDQPGTYAIVIEGITPDGQAGRSIKYFTVK
ncbi:MAG TPA: hypothetical protein VJT83_06865 [Chitinophagaceae bacterium]|nr:hypothetical protein [Chitinophagaceae bacterium]